MAVVAIIEDEPDILEMLNYQLRREGFDVITASSGDIGINLIRKQKPDLVLLDLMLPQKDGLEICREIKNSPATQHIPVIIVSAKGEESDVVLGLGMQADDYIRKPFSPRELIARVRNILRRSDKAQHAELSQRQIQRFDITNHNEVSDLSCQRVEGIHQEEIPIEAMSERAAQAFARHRVPFAD